MWFDCKTDYDSSSPYHPNTLWIPEARNRDGASIEQFKLQVTNTISITQKYTEKCVPKNWITVKPSCPHHEVIHLLPRAPETDLGPGFRENCSRKNLESGSSSSIL